MSNLSYDRAFSLEDTLMPRRSETGARLVREFEAAVRAHAFKGTVEHQDVREEIEEEYERAKKRLLAFIREKPARFDVFREPSTPEDEGRRFYLGSRDTQKEAEALVDEHVKSSKGYYRKSSFTIEPRKS